jgi:predicted PurR-regulated permease PerM
MAMADLLAEGRAGRHPPADPGSLASAALEVKRAPGECDRLVFDGIRLLSCAPMDPNPIAGSRATAATPGDQAPEGAATRELGSIVPGADLGTPDLPPLVRTARPDPGASDGVVAPYPPFSAPSRAAVVVLIAGMFLAVFAVMAQAELVLFGIGLLVVYLIDPAVTWMARHRIPRAIGTLLMMAVLVVGLLVVAEVTFRAIIEQGTAFVKQIPTYIESLTAWYRGLALPEGVRSAVDALIGQIREGIAAIDLGAILSGLVLNVFGVLGSFFSIMGLVFFVFYASADRPRLTRAAGRAIPIPWRADALAVFAIVLQIVGAYIKGVAIIMVLLALMTFAGLTLFSWTIDPAFGSFALFLAVIAMLGELIPSFGPIIALIPALLFALSLGPEAIVATLALYLLIMFIEGQILVPVIQGHQVEVHPALVIVLVLAGAAVGGIVGAIVALPLAAVFRDVTAYLYRRAAGILPRPTIDERGAVHIPDLPAAPMPTGVGGGASSATASAT